MNFITNTLEKNMMLIYCLQTQTDWFMKLKQIMFMTVFKRIKILMIIQISHSQIFYPATKKVIGKMKDQVKRKIISKFVD